MRAFLSSIALLVVVGCSTTHTNDVGPPHDVIPTPGANEGGASDVQTPPSPPPVEAGLRLRAVLVAGDAPPAPFAEKSAVYIRIVGAATLADIVDSSFVFEVRDLAGNLMSTDDPSCRRFHVSALGRIDEVLSGVDTGGSSCMHGSGIAEDGSLLPQLAPFADAPVDADGLESFRVTIFPVGIESAPYSPTTVFAAIAPASCDANDPSCKPEP